jgi:hypothetical protein
MTSRIKALVISGNKFVYACVKEVCRLWAQPRLDTLHQLLIIVETLWSQPALQVGDQVVVSRSEIRAVRCKKGGQTTPSWNAQAVLQYEWLYVDAHCHGGALYRMSAFPWTYAVFCVFHTRVYFHNQYSCSVAENSCHQLSGKQSLFKLLRLVWWMCVHPLFWLLFGFSIHKWNPGFITCYSYDMI